MSLRLGCHDVTIRELEHVQPDLAEGTLRRPVKPAVEEEVKEMVRTLAECPQRRSCLAQITDSDFAEPISMGSRPVYPSSFIVARPLPHLQLLEGNETQRAKTRVHPDILSCAIVYTNTRTLLQPLRVHYRTSSLTIHSE